MQEEVLCINRNETITGKYAFRAMFSSVPKYKALKESNVFDYEGLITSQVLGFDQTMKIEKEKPSLLAHCRAQNPYVVADKDCKSVVVSAIMSIIDTSFWYIHALSNDPLLIVAS